MQSVWTDGSSILSVGLDQRLRCWKLRREQDNSKSSGVGTASEIVTDAFDIDEAEPCAVQVLEPAALHAVHSNTEENCGAAWVVGVVGRGTQLLGYKDTS